MRKDDINDENNGEGQEGFEQSKSALELQRNMKILQKYQRFPLTDLYIEKQKFLQEMRKKYGTKRIDNIIS